jgi:EF-hand domain pair
MGSQRNAIPVVIGRELNLFIQQKGAFMRYQTAIKTVFVATILSAACALNMAQAHGCMRGKIARMDRNGDHVLSITEARTVRAQRFAELDANRNNVIERAELDGRKNAKSAARSANRVARLDSNKDGVISVNEWEQPIEKLFAKVDQNRDGQVTREEFKAFRQARRHA